MFSLVFPTIDPVIVHIGPLVVRWYALAYVAGIFLGWYYIQFLNRRIVRIFDTASLDALMTWSIIGILLGGRIGYVLFYNFLFYKDNPAEILKVWQGGMSFHGGMLGLILSTLLLCRKYKIRLLSATDVIACAAPLGLMFGRIANFINGELYGRITDGPLGMVFPGGGPLPRHPSQLYEAFSEGLMLFLFLAYLVLRTPAARRPGMLGGVFLIGYWSARTMVENFREPDEQLGLFFGTVTMGQILSLPMLITGVFLVMRALRKAPLPLIPGTEVADSKTPHDNTDSHAG